MWYKPTLAVRTDERPAQREAAFADVRVRLEYNEERRTGWRDRRQREHAGGLAA